MGWVNPVRVRRLAAVAMLASVVAVVVHVPIVEVFAPLLLVVTLVVWFRSLDWAGQIDA